MQDDRELGYAMSKDYRRQGYMTEAVKVVCNHLFQNETIKRVTLEILPENLPSLGVARKCGFSLVAEPEEKKSIAGFWTASPLTSMYLINSEPIIKNVMR